MNANEKALKDCKKNKNKQNKYNIFGKVKIRVHLVPLSILNFDLLFRVIK